MADEPAPDHGPGAAAAALAVDVDGLAAGELRVEEVEGGSQLLARRAVEVSDRTPRVAQAFREQLSVRGRALVLLGEVQNALDMLERDGEVAIDVETVGYRSAFIGAVLATLPGTSTALAPPRVIRSGGVDSRAARAPTR